MIFSHLIPILMVIGSIGLFIGYVQPTYNGSVETLKSEIADLDTALTAAEQFRSKEAELTRQRADIPQEQITRLEAFLPDSVDNVQLIVDLNSLAARSGVQLSEFDIVGGESGGTMPDGTPMPSSDGEVQYGYASNEPTESLELTVSATGSYAAFRNFLAGVENSLRPLDLVELSVQDSQTGVYTYDITLRLYWLR